MAEACRLAEHKAVVVHDPNVMQPATCSTLSSVVLNKVSCVNLRSPVACWTAFYLFDALSCTAFACMAV